MKRLPIGRIEAADLARVYAAAYQASMAAGMGYSIAESHAASALDSFASKVEDMAAGEGGEE